MTRTRTDRRLLGTWISDKRRTFKHYVPPPSMKPKQLRKFKSLFGKLVLRYGHKRVYSELNGVRSSGKYQVLASDSDSVVIISYSELWEENRIQHIHFEDDCYWIWAWEMQEYFKRVPKVSR